MSIFRSTKPPPPKTTSRGRRFGRRRKTGGEADVAKNRKVPATEWKTSEWRVKGAERLALARAWMQERVSHLAGWMTYRFYAITHPCRPLRRRAAKRAAEHKRIAATERRIQNEAAARSKAAAKRASAWEARKASDDQRVSLLA